MSALRYSRKPLMARYGGDFGHSIPSQPTPSALRSYNLTAPLYPHMSHIDECALRLLPTA